MAKKYICTVCGYIHEGDSAPERCPMCKVPSEKFNELQEGGNISKDDNVLFIHTGGLFGLFPISETFPL